jgi:hypothetical protein
VVVVSPKLVMSSHAKLFISHPCIEKNQMSLLVCSTVM